METAKSAWHRLFGRRAEVLNRAREAAELTIPSICPPDGSNETSRLPTPYQSLGARGVNNLASKLQLSLLPTDSAFFRFQLSTDIAAQFPPDALGEIETRLRLLENALMDRITAKNSRVMIHSALRHIIVTGNACIHMPADKYIRMFSLNQFCVVRDPVGTVTEAVICEKVHPSSLDERYRDLLADKATDSDDHVELFTHIKLVDGYYDYYQELADKKVPGSEGRAKKDECPYIFLRWNSVENEDYGRGMVEEYIGDLRSLEGISKAILQFTAVASRIIMLLDPNSTTDADELRKANSGDIITGNVEDIGVLQLDKFPDFAAAERVLDRLELRLSHSFLLRSGTVREAERVTAEEIRAQAQELEDVLGGTYTVLAQGLQLPMVRRELALMRKDGLVSELPEGVDPVIITGFEALGRGHELTRLRTLIGDLTSLLGDRFIMQLDPQATTRRFSNGYNLDVEDILRDPQEVQQEMMQNQMQALAEKAAGPVAGAVAGAATTPGA